MAREQGGGRIELAGEVIGAVAASAAACWTGRLVQEASESLEMGVGMHIDAVSRWTRKRAAFIGAEEL
jgi:hypothetical protein